jgi:hypothetical protein
MFIRRFFVFLLVVMMPFALLGKMPHWKLWQYQLEADIYEGGCDIKLTPRFAGIFNLSTYDIKLQNKKENTIVSNKFSDLNYKFITECKNDDIEVRFAFFADKPSQSEFDDEYSLKMKKFWGGYFYPRAKYRISYLDDFLVLSGVSLGCNKAKEIEILLPGGPDDLDKALSSEPDNASHEITLNLNLQLKCTAYKVSSLFG